MAKFTSERANRGGRRSGTSQSDRMKKMNIDERLEALAMNLELAHRDIQDLLTKSRQDGENIRALARIAEIHEKRISHIEEGR